MVKTFCRMLRKMFAVLIFLTIADVVFFAFTGNVTELIVSMFCNFVVVAILFDGYNAKYDKIICVASTIALAFFISFMIEGGDRIILTKLIRIVIVCVPISFVIHFIKQRI